MSFQSKFQLNISESGGDREKYNPEVDSSFLTKPIRSNDDQGKFLILINPHSGRGKSKQFAMKIVVPIMTKKHLDYEIFETKANDRVSNKLDSMTTAELLRYRCLLVVSGDGMVHEILNSLMRRKDWQETIKIPIGVVPAGSGNGLAYTLIRQEMPNLQDCQEAMRLCCEQACNGSTTRIDIIRVTFGPDQSMKEYWSFLSIGWGILADIDIESEWLRCTGNFRFTIYGLLKSLKSPSYKGSLSYKRSLHSSDLKDASIKEDEWIQLEGYFSCIYGVYLSHIASNTKFAPEAAINDRIIYLTIVRGKLSPKQVIQFLLAIQDGSHKNLTYVEVIPVTSFKFQPLEQSKIVIDGELIPWTIDDGPISVDVISEKMTLAWNSGH